MKKIFTILTLILTTTILNGQETQEKEGPVNTYYTHKHKDILSIPVYQGCEKIPEGENTKLHKCMSEKINQLIGSKITDAEFEELASSGTMSYYNVITLHIDKNGDVILLKSHSSNDRLYEKLIQPRIKEAFEQHPRLIPAKTKNGRFVDFQHNVRVGIIF